MIPHPPAGLLDILATGPLASDDMAILLQVGGKAMHELDYSSRSLMQLCKTRCCGYLIASALLP